jgi:hypothetical protein
MSSPAICEIRLRNQIELQFPKVHAHLIADAQAKEVTLRALGQRSEALAKAGLSGIEWQWIRGSDEKNAGPARTWEETLDWMKKSVIALRQTEQGTTSSRAFAEQIPKRFIELRKRREEVLKHPQLDCNCFPAVDQEKFLRANQCLSVDADLKTEFQECEKLKCDSESLQVEVCQFVLKFNAKSGFSFEDFENLEMIGFLMSKIEKLTRDVQCKEASFIRNLLKAMGSTPSLSPFELPPSEEPPEEESYPVLFAPI